MSILQTFKKLLQTPEAHQLKHEVSEQVSDAADKTKQVAGSVYTKGRAAAQGVVETVGEKIQNRSQKIGSEIVGKIDYDTFKKVEIRVGTIVSVSPIEKSDKLLKLMVNVGETDPRQIISGIAPYFSDITSLQGRQAMFVTNLQPRTIFGYESDGMIFAVHDDNGFSLLEPDMHIAEGTQAS